MKPFLLAWQDHRDEGNQTTYLVHRLQVSIMTLINFVMPLVHYAAIEEGSLNFIPMARVDLS